mgnify:CR=1 FL=1
MLRGRLLSLCAVLTLGLMVAGEDVALAHGDSSKDGGQESSQEEPNEPPKSVQNRVRSHAWRLTHKAGRGDIDLFYAVENTVSLSGEQKKALEKLEKECKDQKDNVKGCMHKLRGALGPGQVESVKKVVDTLQKLQEDQHAAARDFLKAADPQARKKADEGCINTSDLTHYMDLPEPKRKELDRLFKEMYARVEKRMKGKEPPEDLDEREARRWKAQQHREARQEAREWYESQRDTLLNQGQLEKLKTLEQVAREYRNRLREAHRSCAGKLQTIMLKAAGYDVPEE